MRPQTLKQSSSGPLETPRQSEPTQEPSVRDITDPAGRKRLREKNTTSDN